MIDSSVQTVHREEWGGPLDVIGDVHGCASELEALLGRLGYERTPAQADETELYAWDYRHPEGRRAVFVGDLVDRGPRILDAYRLVARMVQAGQALCVAGNHDDKLRRSLAGRPVEVKNGLEDTLRQLAAVPDQIQAQVRQQMLAFFSALPSHVILDEGRLVVVHAGIRAGMIGQTGPRVRDFALYGETTKGVDEYGLPLRLNWAANYSGQAWVIYGHTPLLEPLQQGRTINIDTGCVYGGSLTALRYPEMTFVSIPAADMYAPPKRPLQTAEQILAARSRHTD